jgi:hypothetical protein
MRMFILRDFITVDRLGTPPAGPDLCVTLSFTKLGLTDTGEPITSSAKTMRLFLAVVNRKSFI